MDKMTNNGSELCSLVCFSVLTQRGRQRVLLQTEA